MKEIQVWIYTRDSIQEVQDYILSLQKEADEYCGNAKVFVYEPVAKTYKKLSHIYNLSRIAVNVLREYYGENKIRVVVREELEQIPEEDSKSQILDHLNDIADYLESIDNSLKKLSVYMPNALGEKIHTVGGNLAIGELVKGEQW